MEGALAEEEEGVIVLPQRLLDRESDSCRVVASSVGIKEEGPEGTVEEEKVDRNGEVEEEEERVDKGGAELEE